MLWGFSVAHGDPMEILMTVKPTGDLVAAYKEIVSFPVGAWMHGENSVGFPTSIWERLLGGNGEFLAASIESATVTCEHWSTPERLVYLGGPGSKR